MNGVPSGTLVGPNGSSVGCGPFMHGAAGPVVTGVEAALIGGGRPVDPHDQHVEYCGLCALPSMTFHPWLRATANTARRTATDRAARPDDDRRSAALALDDLLVAYRYENAEAVPVGRHELPVGRLADRCGFRLLIHGAGCRGVRGQCCGRKRRSSTSAERAAGYRRCWSARGENRSPLTAGLSKVWAHIGRSADCAGLRPRLGSFVVRCAAGTTFPRLRAFTVSQNPPPKDGGL
jgi:hypothetical protein